MKKSMSILMFCLIFLSFFLVPFHHVALAGAGGSSAGYGGGSSGQGTGSGVSSPGGSNQTPQNNFNPINGMPIGGGYPTNHISPTISLFGGAAILLLFLIAVKLFWPDFSAVNKEIDISRMNEEEASFWKDKELKKRIEKCYIQIQKAWSKQNPERAAAYMSNDLLLEHKELIQTMRHNHIRNIVWGIEISRIRAISISPNKDVLHVMITSRVFDYRIDTITGNVISGRKYQRGILEDRWQFIYENGEWVADKIYSAM